MKIVTKKELLEAPVGTVYTRYIPDTVDGELRIKFGNNCNMDVIPMFKHYEIDVMEERETNWSTDDLNIKVDYDDDQLFAVFSKTEVTQMIHMLACALCDGEAYIDMDKVYTGEFGYEDKEWTNW